MCSLSVNGIALLLTVDRDDKNGFVRLDSIRSRVRQAVLFPQALCPTWFAVPNLRGRSLK